MRFGMCIGDDASRIELAAKSGFDFVESGFSVFAQKDDEYFNYFSSELEKYNVKCESVNCFIPAEMKVTGPDVDYEALSAYIEKGISRGVKAGLKKVVFGSGGARNVPDGFSFEEAYRQLLYFLKNIASPVAEKYGVMIVVEPLRKGDTNILNSAQEVASLVGLTNSECVKALVDLYHMEGAGDDTDTVRKLKGSVKHAHIAEPISRKYPDPYDGCDYKAFIAALEYCGCESCSVEASTNDFNTDCPKAYLAVTKQ